MIQDIANTINGWADALHAFAARIAALATNPVPDLSPITIAAANVVTALAALNDAITAKETVV